MRVTQSMLYGQTLQSISDGQARLVKLQDALSSGVRLRQAADDPGAMTRAMRNDDRLLQLERFADNLRALESRYGIMDDEMGVVTDVLHRARELIVQGGNAALDPGALQGLAGELRILGEDVFRIANTRDGQGNYLFAGNLDGAPPFTGDYTAASYVGGAVARQVPIDEFTSLSDSLTGDDVFQNTPAGDLMALFEDLAAVVENGASATRQADLAAGLDRLDLALDHIVAQRVTLGKGLQRVESERDRIEAAGIQLQIDSSALRDTDIAEAVSAMSQELTSLEAARATFSQIQGLSLFDYLR